MDTARELSDRLASLYRNERNAMADFLITLAAFDERNAWREIGYPSLWAFLRHELKLSKSAAFHRKTAAELIQAHPAVAGALRSGELCLSSVAELARVLTPENVGEVLPRFFGLSHREAEALAASLRPAQVLPTRDMVRLLPSAPSRPTPPAVPASTPHNPAPSVPEPAPALAAVPAAEVSAPKPRNPTQAAPLPGRELSTTFLDAERARISVTVPRRVLEKLEAARDALAHVVPDGNGEPPDRLPGLQPARRTTGLRRRGRGPLRSARGSHSRGRCSYPCKPTGTASRAARALPGRSRLRPLKRLQHELLAGRSRGIGSGHRNRAAALPARCRFSRRARA